MDQVNTVLLDTHVFFWLGSELSRLSRPARRAVEHATQLQLADISLRELSLLARSGRIDLGLDPADWMETMLSSHDIEVVPISTRIAARSVNIAQNFHGDPADQLIAATAIELDVPLITADERLRKSEAVRTIW